MESEFEYMLKQENILERYEYLESIMKHYKGTYDKNSLIMNELLVDITKIITPLSANSNKDEVKKVDMFFRILVKNSIRLDKNSIAFKVLSYLIQQGFDLFVNILKDDKSTSLKKYISLLLGILKKKEIWENINLTKQEVENCLNLTQFFNAMKSMKSNNKLFCFVLLFFPKFVKENDQIISEEIKKYLNKKEITNFYEMLDKKILKNKKSEDKKEECNENKKNEDKKEECNDGLENKKNKNETVIQGKEKNEIEDDFSNHLILNRDDSSNVEKKKSGSDSESNNSSSSKNKDSIQEEKVIHSKDNNQYNNNEVLCMIQKLTKEIDDLKRKQESSRKEIDQLKRKYESSGKEIDELKTKQESSGKEIDELKTKQESSGKEIDELKRKYESSGKEIDDLKRKDESLKKEIDELKRKYESSGKEIDDLKRKQESSRKEIDDLKRNVDLLINNNKKLNEQIKSLDEKLNLSLLIISLASQRDIYKKTLEILIKYVISEYKLEITRTEGESLWKYANEVSEKISELNEKEKDEKNKKLVKGLLSLFFCKDYVNCIMHGIGKLSEEIKQSYQKKDVIPFISGGSYENMKATTLQFFGNIVNELEEFKYINSLLREKTKNWNDQKDLNYSRYLTENGINGNLLIEDFNSIIDIMEHSNLSENVDIDD